MLVPFSLYTPVNLLTAEPQEIALESLLPVSYVLVPKLRITNTSTAAEANVKIVETEDLGLSADPLYTGMSHNTIIDQALQPGEVLWVTLNPPFIQLPDQSQVTSEPPVLTHALTFTNLSLVEPIPPVLVRLSIYAQLEQVLYTRQPSVI